MTKIVLDAESFKALASDTRLQILKALDARPLTVSELSRLLDLNKATVFEHLKQLMSAELAKREDDPARKWVYYKLTWKGRNVLHPENAQIFLMLGLGVLGLGGGILQTLALVRARFGGTSVAADPDPVLTESAMDQQKNASNADAPAAGAASQSASTSSSAPQQENSQIGDGGAADPPTDGGGNDPTEVFTSTSMMTMIGIIVFLLLVALLIWALRQDQARERARVRALIEKLPPNVNVGESVS